MGEAPEGWTFHEVAAVGVDQNDNVLVFNRGKHPMIVFDRHGNFLRSWGEDIFSHAHGIHVAPDGTIWCTDDGDHTVRQLTPEGRVLTQIGVPGKASPFMGGQPFNRCTHTALSPKRGHLRVGRIRQRTRSQIFAGRQALAELGTSGIGPGEFNLPHNIVCDPDGWVYVADRESHRIQVFDGNGRFETMWTSVHRPSGMCMTFGRCPLCYVGEIGPYLSVNRQYPNLGPPGQHPGQQGERAGETWPDA